ncbi:MAG: hypothetical protein ABR497_05460 [Kiritimatiellia bacterium]|nr:hypothetical protein [Lentisphaerota bacterium]
MKLLLTAAAICAALPGAMFPAGAENAAPPFTLQDGSGQSITVDILALIRNLATEE